MSEMRQSLSELEKWDDFVGRHIGPDQKSIDAMLSSVGASSLDDLIDRTVPAAIRNAAPLNLPKAHSERYTVSTLRRMSERNKVFVSMIGMGYYGTVTPTVILRNVLEDPGWYTAYTPYQPEVSQGRLQALLNYQQAIIDLSGMEIANASLLDEATAVAEAMAMSSRVSKKKGANGFFLDQDTHPQIREVVETRARSMGFDIVVGDPFDADLDMSNLFGIALQYPGSSGETYFPAGAVGDRSGYR